VPFLLQPDASIPDKLVLRAFVHILGDSGVFHYWKRPLNYAGCDKRVHTMPMHCHKVNREHMHSSSAIFYDPQDMGQFIRGSKVERHNQEGYIFWCGPFLRSCMHIPCTCSWADPNYNDNDLETIRELLSFKT